MWEPSYLCHAVSNPTPAGDGNGYFAANGYAVRTELADKGTTQHDR